MKDVSTKIGYMVIGSLLTLIGYHFGNVDSNTASAQKDDPIVDEIRCRKLVIVGENNTPRIALGTDRTDRGEIIIYNEDGARRIRLGVNEFVQDIDSGILQIQAKESGSTSVALGVDSYGGYMAL